MSKSIAIIGYAFRLPGTTATDCWQNLLDGRNMISQVAADRWAQDSLLHPAKSHPGTSYTFASGSLGDIGGFDAGFFGISPREAAMMDPQQRLLLEMSWEAIENAGIKAATLAGSACGVFVGISSADYSFRLAEDLCAIDATAATGNTTSIAANRISYVFDLHGPSMAIDTACSSALVAFHQACQAIRAGECRQALAGSISLHNHPNGFVSFSKASMLSRKGRCRVFDAAADGYVRSEGGGVFFLKDYAQAVADGDPILAVVAHTAINTDGHKSGLTVPNPATQAALLERVYREAGIDPASIDYLEAHGTGTQVGDPIETHAIGAALGKCRTADNPLLIGSVKSNFGHLEAASGAAGLVKALLCLRHRQAPATIGVETPNPVIDFSGWNLRVVTETTALKKTGKLTVGINSFGFGGANAHIILQSPAARRRAAASAADRSLPLLVSARDRQALKAQALALADCLRTRPGKDFADLAWSSLHHRDWHEHRAMLFAGNARAAATALEQFAGDDGELTPVRSGSQLATPRGPAFVYAGNGSQWPGMGAHLLATEPVFREAVAEIDDLFRRLADFSLLDVLTAEDETLYQDTEIAQPALFALQVGMTRLLASLGLSPVAVAGHSVGEVAAAWAAGALSLEDAVTVIYYRSHYQGTTRGRGGMTAVGLGLDAATALLAQHSPDGRLCIAGVNSGSGVTLAGDTEALAALETELDAAGTFYKRLPLDYAFHSPAMDDIAADIRQTLAGIRPRPATNCDYYSTVSGGLLNGETLDAEYWWLNIRQPVQFHNAIAAQAAAGINIFVEIGPHTVLRSYINDTLRTLDRQGAIIATGTRQHCTGQQLQQAASQAVVAGAGFDAGRAFPAPGRFLPLPTYRWQRERHWHPTTPEALAGYERRLVHPLLGYPLPRMNLCWENQLDTSLQPNLADHMVGDAVVFPSTGFAELAIAASLAWRDGEFARIEELEIHAPLLLGKEHSQLLNVSIDGRDGGLTIRARPYCSTEMWTQHAVGRIVADSGRNAWQPAPALPDRAADFTAASHNKLTAALGFAYGPAFQCIGHGWLDGDSALATLETPAVTTEQTGLHLHPAILDCTFQLVIQLLREEVAANQGFAYIPVKLGNVAFRSGLGRPALAQATLLRRSTHSLLAAFTVYDEAGRAIAQVQNVRMRSVRLGKVLGEQLDYPVCQGVPVPHPAARQPADLPLNRATVGSALADVSRGAALKGSHRQYSEEVDPLLDSLCARFTLQALRELAGNADHLDDRRMLDLQAATPAGEPYLQHLFAQAQADQIVSLEHDGCKLSAEDGELPSAQDIWNTLLADYPDYFQTIHTVGIIGSHLAELLDGRKTLADVCPTASSRAGLLWQTLGSNSRHKISQALRQLLAQSLKKLPAGQRLGIVEITANGPLFAADLCVGMDFNRCDYSYASFATAESDSLERLCERYPDIDVQLIDPDQPRAITGLPCRLAIVTLDFPSLDDTLLALDTARRSLGPGGALVVLGQHPSRWLDFVYGAQRQHWLQSRNATWLSMLRPAQFWLDQLKQLGLEQLELLEFSPNTLSGPYLLVAGQPIPEKPAAAPPRPLASPRSWIIVSDRDGYSAQLSDRLAAGLQQLGDMVIQSGPAAAGELAALLTDTTAKFGLLDGLVHLAGLANGSIAGADLLAAQTARCAQAAAIVQALETAGASTTCWLVCHGAAPELLPTRNPDIRLNAAIPADTALWAFGRTLLNEAAGFAVRLVDLEYGHSTAIAAERLLGEFAAPDAEAEIVIGRDGARFAPRLQLAANGGKAQAGRQFPQVRLTFPFPGQLRNLRWEAQPLTAVGEHEIAVDIFATGLNFRDVMYALGLLSDEAIENGFAGPTLGLEFAGTIRKLGSKVKGFMPGDSVVGFGPSSFGNIAVTKASAITHIPPGISYEAAATIPGVFFTAYYALHHLAQVQPGEKILIHGAAGGVGIAAIQIAKWQGAEIFATAGSTEKRDFLRLLGVNHIFDSRSLDFADDILAATDQAGIDVVLNCLSGEAINRNFRVLKPFGRFLELGKRDFYENTRIGLRPFRNNISYFGIDADQLMSTRPQLTHRLFEEVMQLFTTRVLHPLPYRSFEADDIVAAFRYMQQSRQIGKIVITYRDGISNVHYPPAPPPPPLQLTADATYLVSGGLGGFGLKTAQWLAGKGARHLLLLSRNGAGDAASQAAVAALTAAGVNVRAAACDIADRDALAAVLAAAAADMPPLKGVVHAAAVFQDNLARNLDAEKIRAVLAPKVLGALNLHELTLDLQLDHFILYSSAVTLFGNPGQGNYVAANACLEALARHRQAQGLPGLAVCWGAIDDVGYLARNTRIKDALQNRMGGSALSSDLALAVLEKLLGDHGGEVAVLELDWKALARFLPAAGGPRFRNLARRFGKGYDAGDDTQDLQQQMAELGDAELQRLVASMIKTELAEILRIAEDRIDTSRSIYTMGMDSLMGVELVIAMESRFGVKLPVMALSQTPTIDKLAERLIQQLRNRNDGPEPGAATAMAEQTRQTAALHGVDVADAAIDEFVDGLQTEASATSRIIQ